MRQFSLKQIMFWTGIICCLCAIFQRPLRSILTQDVFIWCVSLAEYFGRGIILSLGWVFWLCYAENLLPSYVTTNVDDEAYLEAALAAGLILGSTVQLFLATHLVSKSLPRLLQSRR